MKRKLNQSIAAILAFSMLFCMLPVNAFANTEDAKTAEEFRLAVLGDEKWVNNYPNGLFSFIGGQFSVAEGNEYLEIAIARQGGTQGDVSVDLKAIDVTSKYGDDYVIKIFENGYKMWGGEQVPAAEDSVPLIDSMASGGEVNISPPQEELPEDAEIAEQEPAEVPGPDSASVSPNTVVDPTTGGEANINPPQDELPKDAEIAEQEPAEVPAPDSTPVPPNTVVDPATGGEADINPPQDELPEDAEIEDAEVAEQEPAEVPAPDVPLVPPYTVLESTTGAEPLMGTAKKGSLREAKEMATGVESDRPNWKAADKNVVENLKIEYDATLGEIPGATTTLHFKDGEYIKYVYIIPQNDTLSEADEQIMLMLETPTGGSARGELYMSTVVITDDEEKEISVFELETDTAYVIDGSAEVVVKRTGGLYQYASVIIGTEEDTALNGADYIAGIQELTFVPGMERQTVKVDILENQYRTEFRQFRIALDVSDENVNAEKAFCQVDVPPAEGARTPDEHNAMLRGASIPVAMDLLQANTALGSGQKISEHGYSHSKGTWWIAPMDFLTGWTNGAVQHPHGHVTIAHTGGGRWAHATNTKLYGTTGLELGFGNVGKGYSYTDWRYEWYFKHVFDWGQRWNAYPQNEKNYKTVFEIDAPNSTRAVQTYWGHQGTNVWATHRTNSLTENQWNTNWIGVYSEAANNNHAEVNFWGIKLDLKKYEMTVLATQTEKNITYDLQNANLKQKSEKVYVPGELIIEEVNSLVVNSQGKNNSRKSAEVYRSDRIRLTMRYSADNANGRYAQYKGFRIKNGNSWIQFNDTSVTQTLDLDVAFFQRNGMLAAIRAGKIEIQPVFEKNATKTVLTVNTQLGHFQNIGVGNARKEFGTLFIGDTISGITARGFAVAMTPKFSAKTNTNRYASSGSADNSGIVITDNIAGSTMNYTIPKAYSELNLTFGNPTLEVKANPEIYVHRATKPVFTVDGVRYSEHSKLSEKMVAVFKAEENPKIKMEFNYLFDESYGGDKATKKAQFGTPKSATLTIYKSDGTVRETKNIAYNQGFSVEGNLKDLGWGIDDYASVSIIGSAIIENRAVQTRETVVDFLYNTQNAVIVTAPDGTLTPSDVQTAIRLQNANPTEEYKLSAFGSGNFITKWADYSADLNGDGNETFVEQNDAMKKLNALGYTGSLADARRPNLYYGNDFFIKPQFFDPTKVFYNFEKKSVEASNFIVSVQLMQKGGSVLEPTVFSKAKPIHANVIVAGKEIQASDDNSGYYFDNDPMYVERGHYLGKVFIAPYEYYFEVQPGIASRVEINTSEIMPPTGFVAEVNGKTVDLKKQSNLLDIENTTTIFSYGFSNAKTGITPNNSKIRIYDAQDVVKNELTTGAPDANGRFQYITNLTDLGVQPGYSMSICGMFEVDGMTQEFPEVPVGLTFRRQLTALTVAASFKTPLSPVIDLIGKVNNAYDLGMDINLTDAFTSQDSYTDSLGRTRRPKMVSFGFNQEFSKDFEDSVKDEAASGDKPNASSKPFVEETMKGNDGSTKDMKNAVDKTKGGTDSAPAVKRGSGSGSGSMKFAISLSIILEEGVIAKADGSGYKLDGENYFSALVIMATAEADVNYSYTYITPIGIPVSASVGASGVAIATLGFEANHSEPFAAKYRLDGSGSVSFNPKNYSSYFKFVVQPTITVGASVGFTYLNIGISGTGAFDFQFTEPIYGENHSSKGSGGLTLSAKLSIKILFIQKHWTLYESDPISLFGYGRASLMSNPYQDYMYQSLGDIAEDTVMPRDYLADKSDWLGERTTRARGVNMGGEMPLIESAYPNPQTKLVKLSDTKTMMLFIDDDNTRDSLNRAILKYSIGEGSIWSEPVAVDTDGTWDEAPDAFVIGDQVLLVWSDASRVLTEEDTEKTILHTMDISAKWYDITTGALSEKTRITETQQNHGIPGVLFDADSDADPKITYDEGTQRLMIYYTKADYYDTGLSSDPVNLSATENIPAEDEALYGDIINGYTAIAYRTAVRNNGVWEWSTTYQAEEGYSQAFQDAYYGQRFLNLAVPATITETVTTSSVEVPIPPEDDIFDLGSITNVTETITGKATYNKDNPTDPRIVNSDVITYNGLALYAYSLDYDSNLKTVDDQKIYLQIYNYADESNGGKGTFTHPILIADSDGQNTMPKFVQSKGITYLYWLSAGDVVYADISMLVKGGLILVDVEGAPEQSAQEIYIIDKNKVGRDVKTIAIAQTADNPIGTFDVESNNDGIYLLWSQFINSYKNGLQQSDPGAEDPANIVREKQLFAAFTSPTRARSNDNPQAPDKEGEVGEVIEGPESKLETVEGFDWSKPVQITFEPGANYDDISFRVTSDNNLQLSYIKYLQELGEHNIFEDKQTDRTLATNNITIRSTLEFSESLVADNTNPRSGDSVAATVSISNTGVKPILGTKYQTYLKVGTQELSVSEWTPVTNMSDKALILGGNTEVITAFYTMPENMQGVTLGIRFNDSTDTPIKTLETPIHAGATIIFDHVTSEMASESTVVVTFVAKNNGNVDYDGKLDIKSRDAVMHSENIMLAVDEEKEFYIIIDIAKVEFTEPVKGEDGKISDTMPLSIHTGSDKVDCTIVRTASKEMADAMQNVKTFALSYNGETLDDSSVISTEANKLEKLDVNYELTTPYDASAGKTDPFEIVLMTSDNKLVALLQDGTFALNKTGTSTVTATLKPINHVVESLEQNYNMLDTSYLYPAGIVQKKTVQLNAPESGGDSSDSGSSSGGGGGSSGSGATVGKNDIIKAIDGIALTTVSKIKSLDILTVQGDATIIFDKTAIAAMTETGGKNVKITVKKQQNADVYELAVSVDEAAITDFKGGRANVTLPYALKDGEVADNIVLYQTVAGKEVCKPFVLMNNGSMTIDTAVLGTFEMKYRKVDFADVSEDDWFYRAVNLSSAREVIQGVGDHNFAPRVKITRADFLVLILRTFGIELDAGIADGFADSGDTYFTQYLNTAKKLGLVSGVGENLFAPYSEISRQDMSVMLYNVLKKQGELAPVQNPNITEQFEDSALIAEYAKEAMTYLTDQNILNGADNKLMAQDNSLRCEVAQIIYNLIKQ